MHLRDNPATKIHRMKDLAKEAPSAGEEII
jgi:hypothetical protein